MNPQDLIENDKKHLIHPLTHPRHFEHEDPKIIVEGNGFMIRDLYGKELIDGFSGLWCVAVGHNHPKIIAAVHEQMQKLSYFTSFHGASTPPSIELAAKLTSMFNPEYGLSRVWFTCGGSETNETNIKMARLYWQLQGKSEKGKVISRRFSYHGMGLATTASTGIFPFHWNIEPLPEGFIKCAAPYCYQCEFDQTYGSCNFECVADLEEVIEEEGSDTVAAFIAEPVIGSGGVIPPPQEYFPRVRELCDKHDVLLILDEVITGFGRTGAMFAHEHWGGIRPDMLSLAKGISSGHIPLGAAVMSGKIYDTIGKLQDEMLPLMHGFTYMNHPVSCAAGLANIQVIEEEGLVEKARVNGDYLLEGLKTLTRHHSVGDVRGMGMLAAIELVADKDTKEPILPENSAPELLANLCWEKGLYIRSSAMETVGIAPALTMDKKTIDKMVDIIDKCVPEMEKKLLKK
ncbi:MAG TPA: aspartate aminotransferase family protein [bacterium]|nr:aspartate aminotransferase family protein [bacterium]